MRPSFCLHSAVLNKWCACLLLASFFPLLRLPAPQSQSAVKIETALFAVIVRKPQCLFRIQTEVWKRCGWVCDSSVVPQRHNNTCMWLYPDTERLSICWCFVLWLSGGPLVSPPLFTGKIRWTTGELLSKNISRPPVWPHHFRYVLKELPIPLENSRMMIKWLLVVVVVVATHYDYCLLKNQMAHPPYVTQKV